MFLKSVPLGDMFGVCEYLRTSEGDLILAVGGEFRVAGRVATYSKYHLRRPLG